MKHKDSQLYMLHVEAPGEYSSVRFPPNPISLGKKNIIHLKNVSFLIPSISTRKIIASARPNTVCLVLCQELYLALKNTKPSFNSYNNSSCGLCYQYQLHKRAACVLEVWCDCQAHITTYKRQSQDSNSRVFDSEPMLCPRCCADSEAETGHWHFITQQSLSI